MQFAWAGKKLPWAGLVLAVGLMVACAAEDRAETKQTARSLGARRAFFGEVGWAYAIEPDASEEAMRADMRKMRDAGASAVYLSHANPGTIEEGMPTEKGLTFAVWYAAVGNPDSHGGDVRSRALEILDAVHRAVRAATDEGLKIVLAVGYQTQMGEAWNRQHPDALRRNADGALMLHWTDRESRATASPYAPDFERDMRAYYAWLDRELVRGNPSIVALNLGDEPMGADYSEHAARAFEQAAYNRNPAYALFPDDEGALPTEFFERRGRFESEVLADIAATLAAIWRDLDPAVWTMMTFHIQRDMFWFPSVEAIFQKTPDNFVVSADTHYHDAPADVPVMHLGLLHNLVGNLASLSNVYGKKLMLWSSANNWGLTPHLGIGEAIENVDIVTTRTHEAGGELAMLMVWGYNIRHQGVFGADPGSIAFDPEGMFQSVSNRIASERPTLSTRTGSVPARVRTIDKRWLDEHVGRSRFGHLTGSHLFDWGAVQSSIADAHAQELVMVEGPATRELAKRGSVVESL